MKRILQIINNNTNNIIEFGLGDNAFSSIQDDFISNFLYTPQEVSQDTCQRANHFATVRYAVETINASIETFRALNETIRMSPKNSLNEILKYHHYMSCLCLYIIRETQHDSSTNDRIAPTPIL